LPPIGNGAKHEKNLTLAGLSRSGRGWVRTSDLSRVRQQALIAQSVENTWKCAGSSLMPGLQDAAASGSVRPRLRQGMRQPEVDMGGRRTLPTVEPTGGLSGVTIPRRLAPE
jgi:hypothetical protein